MVDTAKSGHVGKQQCPARQVTCCKCHSVVIFRVYIGVKAVSTEDPEDDFFVDAVKEPTPLVVPTISSGTDPWTVDVLLNDCRIEFQIDTGANVSVISEEQCRT